MTSRALVVALAAASAGACSADATQVRRNQKRVAADTGVAVGRFGLSTRRRVDSPRFELHAVHIPGDTKYRIPFLRDPDGDGASAPFLVNLPAGQYRLTRWTVGTRDGEWGGDDTGLAMEVKVGEVSCVGGLYLTPRERAQMFADEEGPPPQPEVRDDCPAIVALLRKRAPRLADAPVVRLARSVVAAPGIRAEP